jgi:hypothetical protein
MSSALGTKLAECMHVEANNFTDYQLLGKCTQHILELRQENDDLKARLAWTIAELETANSHLSGRTK